MKDYRLYAGPGKAGRAGSGDIDGEASLRCGHWIGEENQVDQRALRRVRLSRYAGHLEH